LKHITSEDFVKMLSKSDGKHRSDNLPLRQSTSKS